MATRSDGCPGVVETSNRMICKAGIRHKLLDGCLMAGNPAEPEGVE